MTDQIAGLENARTGKWRIYSTMYADVLGIKYHRQFNSWRISEQRRRLWGRAAGVLIAAPEYI